MTGILRNQGDGLIASGAGGKPVSSFSARPSCVLEAPG